MKKKLFFFGISFLIVLFLYLNVDTDGYKGADALELQLNTLLSSHDLATIKTISSNDFSYKVLSEASIEDVVISATGAQGGDEHTYFYMARLKGYNLKVLMKRASRMLLGPQYEIYKVTVLPK